MKIRSKSNTACRSLRPVPGTRMTLKYGELWEAHAATLPAGSRKGIESAFDHFLEAVNQNRAAQVGPEFDEDYQASIQRFEQALRRKDNKRDTITQKISRVNKIQETWIRLKDSFGLPNEFKEAFDKVIEDTGLTPAQVARKVADHLKSHGSPKASKSRVACAFRNWSIAENTPNVRTLDILISTEEVLGIRGALFRKLPHLQAVREFREEMKSSGKDITFGQLLRSLREHAGLSVPQLLNKLALPAKVHSLFYGWEADFGRKPSEKNEGIVEQLDWYFQADGALLERYAESGRKDMAEIADAGLVNQVEALSPKTSPEDIAQSGDSAPEAQGDPVKQKPPGKSVWTAKLEMEFKAMAKFKSKPVVEEGLDRIGRWNQETIGIHRKDYGYFFGWLVREKGFVEAKLSLAMLADSALIREYVEARRLRFQCYNAFSVTFASAIRSHTRAETGYFWQCPSVLLSCDYIVSRLPSHEKTRRGRGPMIRLESLEEKAMVLCEQTNANLRKLIRGIKVLEGTKDFQPTRDPEGRIKKILNLENAVDALIICSERMECARPPLRFPVRWATHIRNELIIALLSVYPYREGTVTRLLTETHVIQQEEDWIFAIEADLFKNGAPGLGAEHGWHGRVHKRVAKLLSLYLEKARPILLRCSDKDDGRLFICAPNFRRKPAGLKSIFSICVNETRKYIPDYAPNGINPHAFRKIVGTNCASYDNQNGTSYSQTSLLDKKRTVDKHYAKVKTSMILNRYTSFAEDFHEERLNALRKSEKARLRSKSASSE